MSTIHELREKIDYKLDLLKLETAAIEDELNTTHEQAIQKYEALKKSFRETLVTVKQKLKDFKELSDDQRKILAARIDEVQINLAQSKADTEQRIWEQRQKLVSSVKELEKSLDQYLKEKSSELTRQMLLASDRLNAEFVALEVFFALQNKAAKERFQNKKGEFVNKLHDLKVKLASKREVDIKKSTQLQKELTEGLRMIKSAFQHLKD